MTDSGEIRRKVWSCSLLALPEENEVQALSEQLLAREADFWEDAAALRRFLHLTGMSQAACARALGRSQASVANRLRLLRLPEDVRERMRRSALSERHARALLRLAGGEDLRSAVEHILSAGLNVAETEAYVERCLERKRDADMPDAVYGPLLAELDNLRRTVPGISFTLEENDTESLFCVRIPKKSRKTE